MTVRGLKTRELLNVVTEITDPLARIQIVPGRKLNPWLIMSEALWILAGRNDLAGIAPFNSRMHEFSDDGRTLHGAYGRRIAHQIPAALKRLREDQHDRRAVLQIWGTGDLTAETNDPPCNQQVLLKVRGQKLHMVVTNRSNDLHWGLHAVNIPTFSILMEYLAAVLGVGLGTQTHFSQSLHIYTEGPAAKITADMMAAKEEFKPIKGSPLFGPYVQQWSEEAFAQMCSKTLDGQWTLPMPRFLGFASDFLSWYKLKALKTLSFSGNEEIYPDWIAAAEHFVGKRSL